MEAKEVPRHFFELTELPKQNVDTGSGLERITMVAQGKDNIFATDMFSDMMTIIKTSASAYDERAARIVADHIRTSVFLIADGVTPSNTDQGYILRRLLRRAVRYSDVLGLAGGFNPLIDAVAKLYKGVYENIEANLTQIKKEIGSKEEIKLDHLLKFSEIFKADDTNDFADEWDEVKKLIAEAVKDLTKMKMSEGKTLEKDMMKRLANIDKKLESVGKLSKQNLKDTKTKTRARVEALAKDVAIIDEKRLEYELTMINDKLDITEENVRAKSHFDYFVKCVKEKELSGRRLNFLIQELNREINTMASKSNNSKISQTVVEMKEELEKIREQLQNVE